MRTSFLVVLAACSPGDPVEDEAAGVRIAPAVPGAVQDGPAVAIAGDGGIGVSWVEHGGAASSVQVGWSTDGRRFEGPWALPIGDARPVASVARRPRIAVDGERVAVVFSDGVYPDARVWLHVVDRDDPGRFAVHLLDETGPDRDTLDQPVVAFAPDGELWTSWKVGLDHDVRVVLARETGGFVPEDVEGFPGLPCPCCPHELGFDGDELLMMQRGDEWDLREIYLGRQGADGFAASRVSRNGWVVGGCPFDGPRWVRLADERFLAAWMDATPGEPRIWTATSGDGAVWSDGAQALPGSGEPQAFPVPVVVGDRVFLAVEELFQRTRLLVGDGSGAWDEEGLDTPDGPLLQVDGASAGGQAGLVGVAGDGLWFVPLPSP